MSKADMNDDAELSRAYAATPRDEPPAAVDEAILAKARAALNSQARSAEQDKRDMHAGSRHWSQRFAIAATLVVTASLVVMMQNEQSQIPQSPAPPRDAAIAPAAKIQTEAVQLAGKAPAFAVQSPEKTPANATADRGSSNNASEPPAMKHEPPASPASRLADDMTASAPARQAFPGARQEAMEHAKASAEATVPRASPPSADLQAQPSNAPAPNVTGIASGPATVERRSLKAAEGAAHEVFNPKAAKDAVSPEAWLARIAEMRKQGRVKEADESLAEFRKRYPDYPVAPAKAQTP